jgi:hypothetical protein
MGSVLFFNVKYARWKTNAQKYGCNSLVKKKEKKPRRVWINI